MLLFLMREKKLNNIRQFSWMTRYAPFAVTYKIVLSLQPKPQNRRRTCPTCPCWTKHASFTILEADTKCCKSTPTPVCSVFVSILTNGWWSTLKSCEISTETKDEMKPLLIFTPLLTEHCNSWRWVSWWGECYKTCGFCFIELGQ